MEQFNESIVDEENKIDAEDENIEQQHPPSYWTIQK